MSNKLNELVDKLAEKKLQQLQPLKREPAKVLTVSQSGLRAKVRLTGGSEYELLNKTGEKLSEGDSVWVEYRTLPSSGYIAMRNGEAVPATDTSELEAALEELSERIDIETSYSVTEHEVGKWLDGSVLYERTYVIEDASAGRRVPLYVPRLKEVVGSEGALICGNSFSPFTDYSFSDTELITASAEGKLYITARYIKAESGPSVVYTWAELSAALGAGGNIKLGSDITAETSDEELWVSEGVTSVLDLNGKVLDRAGAKNILMNQGNLTINDSIGTGRITGAAGNRVFPVTNDEGTMTINGCEISGNMGLGASYQSGTILSYGGTVTLNDCSIINNTSYVGGALYIAGGEVYINNCHINYNTATNNAGAIKNSGGTIIINGGEIVGNVAQGGGQTGGIDSTSNRGLHIKGNVKIINNTAWGNSYDTVPRISHNIKAPLLVLDGELEAGSEIGIRRSSGGVITSGWQDHMGSADPAGYFISDNEQLSVALQSGEAALV